MEQEHSKLGIGIAPLRRKLTPSEMGWIRLILQGNSAWAEIAPIELCTIGFCTCGCRSVELEHLALPQNTTRVHVPYEILGEVVMETNEGKSISVLLHARAGYLHELEIICNDNSEPMPFLWNEKSRALFNPKGNLSR